MFFTFGMIFRPRCTVCEMILEYTLALTLPTPGMACTAACTVARMASIWLLAG